MSVPFQSGAHPDADVLSAFLEGALAEHERQECLAHFAACDQCREVVFLAQEPEVAPERRPAPIVPTPVPWWRRWYLPAGLVGAAAACALIVTASLHRKPAAFDQAATVASTAEMSPAAPNAEVRPSNKSPEFQPPPAKPESSRASAPARAKREPPAVPPEDRVLSSKASTPAISIDSPQPPNASGGGGGGRGGRAAAPSQEVAAGQAVASMSPLPQAPLSAAAPQPAPTPLAGTAGASSASALLAPRMSLDQAPASRLVAGPLRLSVQHDGRAEDELSQISGSVVDATGGPVPNATVALSQSNGVPASATHTDAGGKFELPAVNAGQYQLRIQAAGFQPALGRIELQPKDVAKVAPVLQVGAVTETIEVSAGANPDTQSARSAKVLRGFAAARGFGPAATALAPLPSKLPIVTSASAVSIVVAADSAGGLFYSVDSGRTWKAVTPNWEGGAVKLETLPQPLTAGADQFRLTTAKGVVMLSADGAHWHPAPPQQ